MRKVPDHIPVLLEQIIRGLNIRPDGTYVDCTLGGAGHSIRIARELSENGQLIGIDQDAFALRVAKERLAGVMCRVHLVNDNFRYLSVILDRLNVSSVDGVLMDVGVSSFQLDQGERGFSYNYDAPLDMRMDRTHHVSAYDIVNDWEEEALSRVLWEYGEERFSRKIARAIVNYRKGKLIQTTGELADIVKGAIPAAARRRGAHPAKRTFQAIRIAVNDELSALEEGLKGAIDRLTPGGRLCVITFHSLEDRLVKRLFRAAADRCTCPPNFPTCVCGKKAVLRLINRKPIVPDEEEIKENPRSRSAKLRIAEKVEEENG